MRIFGRAAALLAPMLAMSAPGAASNGADMAAKGGDDMPHAIGLRWEESDSSVEIQIVAQSATTQKVDYAIELVGNSRSRHRGSTTIPANEESVLSRLSTGYSDSWCATVDVTEGDGTHYTLTAGDCDARA
ncbi:MAG: curli-like amyloid fiber formation chaperone CsgH [Erythrobacter sp.]